MRYINTFSDSGAVQTALNENTLGKPYIAEISGVGIDYDSLSPAVPPTPGPDYSQMYLTLEALETGTFNFSDFEGDAEVYYSINEGSWLRLYDYTQLSLSSGDTVRFKADIPNGTINYLFAYSSGIAYRVYGNIESMEYGDDFIGKTTIRNDMAFQAYFGNSQNLVSAENLVLPATTLKMACYYSMFMSCRNLTAGPILPAKVLANYCYGQMFKNTPSLTGITCLATDVSAQNCCMNWVEDTSASGTFVKNPNMSSWTTGDNGIPDNWTVLDADI